MVAYIGTEKSKYGGYVPSGLELQSVSRLRICWLPRSKALGGGCPAMAQLGLCSLGGKLLPPEGLLRPWVFSGGWWTAAGAIRLIQTESRAAFLMEAEHCQKRESRVTCAVDQLWQREERRRQHVLGQQIRLPAASL